MSRSSLPSSATPGSPSRKLYTQNVCLSIGCIGSCCCYLRHHVLILTILIRHGFRVLGLFTSPATYTGHRSAQPPLCSLPPIGYRPPTSSHGMTCGGHVALWPLLFAFGPRRGNKIIPGMMLQQQLASCQLAEASTRRGARAVFVGPRHHPSSADRAVRRQPATIRCAAVPQDLYGWSDDRSRASTQELLALLRERPAGMHQHHAVFCRWTGSCKLRRAAPTQIMRAQERCTWSVQGQATLSSSP